MEDADKTRLFLSEHFYISTSQRYVGWIKLDLRKLNQICSQMAKQRKDSITLDDGTIIKFKRVEPVHIGYDIGGK